MSQGDLYVGYLPLPTAHRKTLRITIGVLLLAIALTAAATAAFQRDPGPAVWDTANERTLTGLVLTNPYPTLETDDGAYLVVEMGKVGAQRRLEPFHRQSASLTGYLLVRDGRRMIELAPAEDAVRQLAEARTSSNTLFAQPVTTYVGEILDSKCYLGAMKPGDGKAHKACATLCIDGGIPPMLYTTRPDGTPVYFVLMTGIAEPAGDLVRDYLGEPVRVRGEPFVSGQINYLRIDEFSIERVGR